MALTLTYGQSSSIKAIANDGSLQTFDLGVRMSELIPQLTIPSILDLMRNTSAPAVDSFANMRFYSLAKMRKPTGIYYNGQQQTDPSTITADTIRTEIVQLTPVEIGDKLEMNDIDLNTDKFENALALSAGSWIQQNRIEMETYLFREAAIAAQDIQNTIVSNAADTGATTFKLGAHVQKSNLNTPDDAYNALSDVKNELQKLGLSNAATKFNRDYKFATGINLTDVICVCTPAFLDLIAQKSGLFASEPGFELFKVMGIKRILGLDIVSCNTLPEGVNFMIFTTGIHGSIAYTPIADGLKMIIDKNPNWFMGRRLDISKQYIAGIVHPARIWMHVNENVTITKNMNFTSKISSAINSKDLEFEPDIDNENRENTEKIKKATFFKKADNKENID